MTEGAVYNIAEPDKVLIHCWCGHDYETELVEESDTRKGVTTYYVTVKSACIVCGQAYEASLEDAATGDEIWLREEPKKAKRTRKEAPADVTDSAGTDVQPETGEENAPEGDTAPEDEPEGDSGEQA